MRKMEKTVIDLVEESCLANEKNDTKLVDERANAIPRCHCVSLSLSLGVGEGRGSHAQREESLPLPRGPESRRSGHESRRLCEYLRG